LVLLVQGVLDFLVVLMVRMVLAVPGILYLLKIPLDLLVPLVLMVPVDQHRLKVLMVLVDLMVLGDQVGH